MAFARGERSGMQAVAIVGMCMLAAVCYGILHDQITARVCVEYFTVGHPPVFATEDPTLLGIGWGIIASWWVGLLLGIPLAVVACVGSRPRRSVGSLVRPVVYLLLVTGVCAWTAGVAGWLLASTGMVALVGPIAHILPPDRHIPYIAVKWAHSTSYLVGTIGGMIVILLVWRWRVRATANPAV